MPRRPGSLDRRCRRPAQPRPRRHDGLHAAARAPLRYGGRRTGADGVGDDIRQPGRRTHLFQRRRCTRPTFASGRRLADAQQGHPRAVRRLRGPRGRSAVPNPELPIRRSRGYAPLPVALPISLPPTLAVGADLKNTLAIADRKYAWLSQHIGDMDDLPRCPRSARRNDISGIDRGGTGSPCRRLASAVSLDRLGAPQRRGRPVRTVSTTTRTSPR